MKYVIGALALLAGAFSGSAPALAQAGTASGPPQPPAGISQAISGRFKVIQIATVDVRRFEAAWANRGEQVSLPTAGAAARNQPISAFIIFTGCQEDARGNCNVHTDFEIYGPEGEVYHRRAAQPQWIGPPAPDGRIMLGVSGITLTVENGDKLGTYRLRSFTVDKVANVSVSNEIPVSIAEAK